MAGSIVVFGATGYTGELVSSALVTRGARPILAARSPERLDALATALGGLPTRVADVSKPETVRPLTALGYDWVPGNLAAALALREAGAEATRVQIGYFSQNSGGISGGTRASMFGAIVEPSFAFRGGKLVVERGTAHARRFGRRVLRAEGNRRDRDIPHRVVLSAAGVPKGVRPESVAPAIVDRLSLLFAVFSLALACGAAALYWCFPFDKSEHDRRLAALSN